jgi:hypothetical protein
MMRRSSVSTAIVALLVPLLASVLLSCQMLAPSPTPTAEPAPTPTPTPTATPTPTPTPPPLAIFYQHPTLGFTVRYPEGWRERPAEPPAFLWQIERDSLEVRLEGGCGELEGASLDDVAKMAKESLKELPQGELVSEQYVRLGDVRAYEIVYIGYYGEPHNHLRKGKALLIPAPGRLFVLNASAPAERFDAVEPELTRILYSFDVLSEYTCPPPEGEAPSLVYHEDKLQGFSLSYPEACQPEIPPAGAEDFAFSVRCPDMNGWILVSVDYLSEAQTLERIWEQRKMEAETTPDMKLLSDQRVVLEDGTPALELVFEAKPTGELVKIRELVVVRGDQVFRVDAVAPPDLFDKYAESTKAIFTFRLLPTYTYVSPTPSEEGKYSSPEHGFSLVYPQDWTERPPEVAVGQVFAVASPDQMPMAGVIILKVAEGTTLDEFVPQAMDYAKSFHEFGMIFEGPTKLADGTPAYEMVYKYPLLTANLIDWVVLVVRGTQGFIAYATTRDEQFEQHKPVMDQVVHSFRLEPQITPGPPTATYVPVGTPTLRPTPTPAPTATPTPAPIPLMQESSALLAGKQGIIVLGPEGWWPLKEKLELPSDRVVDVEVDSQGRLWVLDSGVSVFDGRGWTHYPSDVFEYSSLKAIAFDAKGRAWVAHYRGVSVLEGDRWVRHDAEEFGLGEYAGNLYDITVDGEGRVWVATGSGVSAFDGIGWKPFDDSSGLASKYTETIAAGPDGRIWVGHSGGVSVFDGEGWMNYGTGTNVQVEVKGLSQAKALAVSDDGSVWAVTFAGKAAVFRDGHWTVYDRTNSGLLGGHGTAIAIDRQGRVWVGTDWQVAVFDGERWVTYTKATSGLTSGEVTSIAFFGKGPDVLPEPEGVGPGSVRGRLLFAGEPLQGAEVYVCWDVAWPMFFGDTPCSGERYVAATDAAGEFLIEGVPMGSYEYAMHTSEGWYVYGTFGMPGSFNVDAGQAVNLGDVKLGE